MTPKQDASKLADVLNADTTSFWMLMLARNILTLTTLERYCEWLREQVLKADQGITLAVCRTDFDFFKAFSNSPICLCMAASIGTKSYIERKITKVKLETLFARTQKDNEGIAKDDEGKLIGICLKELNNKLEEFAENPCLLPRKGLLTLR